MVGILGMCIQTDGQTAVLKVIYLEVTGYTIFNSRQKERCFISRSSDGIVGVGVMRCIIDMCAYGS